MYSILKKLLFSLDAEKAHSLTTSFFTIICSIPLIKTIVKRVFYFENKDLETKLWGLTFKNPVGLAAGFDKDGNYIRSMESLGFGFLELGTVTPRPQIGNPKPRLFRLLKDEAIINRMGFNNRGVDHLVKRLVKLGSRDIVLGGNIGKNKDTPNDQAYKDYLLCFQKLYDYVDYFVVNLSSPNTPGLRELQGKKPLSKILNTLLDYKNHQEHKKPILLKISPDLSESQLDDVIDIVLTLKIDGLIATNTTISRNQLQTSKVSVDSIGAGGLSGKPLYNRATAVVQYLSEKTKGAIPIVAVGGISSGSTAQQKLLSGAQLVQVYSGLIYEGPFLIKKIKKHLLSKRA